MALMESLLNIKLGIYEPFLFAWGWSIQLARSSSLVVSRPVRIVDLFATWVRSGPAAPPAGVPRMRWQPAQVLVWKRVSPARASASAGGLALRALESSQRAKSAGS